MKTKYTLKEITEINSELFTAETNKILNKVLSFIPKVDKYYTLDSDTDYELFNEIIEEEFIGTISFNSGGLRFQTSDYNEAILFSEEENELSYIISSVKSLSLKT